MAMVAVSASSPELLPQAAAIARQFNLPLLASPASDDSFYLMLTPERLQLCLYSTAQKNATGPVYVDFLAGKAAHRRQFGGGRGQPLAKAVGLKHGLCPSVLDVTAGLGRDAFVLAGLGCQLRLLERSPVIAALLQDGLQRAADDDVVRDRMQLIHADSREFLARLGDSENEYPDVIYLDPMYPKRSKSALVKKEMRALQQLIGGDDDAPELLKAALGIARQRVVVKRPQTAPVLDGPAPDFLIESKNTRFDVYLSARDNKSATQSR